MVACSCSEAVLNLTIAYEDLVLERGDVPSLPFKIVKLRQLLLLFLAQMVEVRMHGARQTCAT